MSAPLYELVGAYRQLMDATVDYETGEVNEDNVPGFQQILEHLEGDLKVKLEGCAKAVKMMEADIASLDAEEKRLYARRKSIEASKKHLRGYMITCLLHAGLEKVKTLLFTIYTTPPKEKVEIVDEKAIPMGYREVPGPPPPDKKLILNALQAGKKVEGAKLVKGDPTLVIR